LPAIVGGTEEPTSKVSAALLSGYGAHIIVSACYGTPGCRLKQPFLLGASESSTEIERFGWTDLDNRQADRYGLWLLHTQFVARTCAGTPAG